MAHLRVMAHLEGATRRTRAHRRRSSPRQRLGERRRGSRQTGGTDQRLYQQHDTAEGTKRGVGLGDGRRMRVRRRRLARSIFLRKQGRHLKKRAWKKHVCAVLGAPHRLVAQVATPRCAQGHVDAGRTALVKGAANLERSARLNGSSSGSSCRRGKRGGRARRGWPLAAGVMTCAGGLDLDVILPDAQHQPLRQVRAGGDEQSKSQKPRERP